VEQNDFVPHLIPHLVQLGPFVDQVWDQVQDVVAFERTFSARGTLI